MARLRRGLKMQVMTRCKDGTTAVGEDIESTIAEGADDNILLEITPSMLREIALMPQVRRKKILGVWEQLAQGTYDMDERLDAVMDCLLTAITAQDKTPGRSTHPLV